MAIPDDDLNGIRGVRKRPAMYVGDTQARGLHQLAFDVFDECVEELLSGFGTHIAVRLHLDGSLEVSDDGRTISLQPLAEFDGRSLFQVLFTRVEVGPNYRGPRHWRVGTRVFGIGFFVDNALSEWFIAEMGDGSTTTRLQFERGEPVGELRQTSSPFLGLRVHFKPDASIFADFRFRQVSLVTRLIELTGLNQGITIDFVDEATAELATIQFASGVADFVRLLNRHRSPSYGDVLSVSHSSPEFRLDVAMQHVNEAQCCAVPYVNTILNDDGGTHWIGFRAGLTKAMQKAFADDSSVQIDGPSLLRGLTAVVSIWLDDPIFEGPTRSKFAQTAIRGTVESLVYREFSRLFAANPELPYAIWRRSQQTDEIDKPLRFGRPLWTLADYIGYSNQSTQRANSAC